VVLSAVDHNEEVAFWLLVVLVERICFPGTFGHNLSGSHQDYVPLVSSKTEMARDCYGFDLCLETPAQLADYARTIEQNAQQSVHWGKLGKKLPSDGKLKKLVRGGIPPTHRAWAWYEISGARLLKEKHASPSYYANLVKAASLSKAAEQVEVDLPRTFPGHPYLACPDTGMRAMRSILTSYSLHNPQVGYCQGLNYIVGVVLSAVERNEEVAFWLLVVLVERICFPGTFGHNLSGAHVEMKTLQDLIQEKLPRLGAHMAALGCDASLIATDWFLTVYCASMPPETACRVLDALFYEGAKVLFRVALALLKTAEAALLRVDNAGDFMRTVKDFVSGLYNADGLMRVAFDGIGSLSLSSVDAVRKLKEQEVKALMEQRRQQRSSQAAQRPTAGT
ncbi:TBC1 domain family member 2A, partial [Tetrabaena socialis]